MKHKNIGRVRSLSPLVWLQLTLISVFILALAGCGGGGSDGTAGSSGPENTGTGGGTTGGGGTMGQTTIESETTSEGAAKTEEAGNTEQALAEGKLGAPALGDAGAPVVMVEYADYQ